MTTSAAAPFVRRANPFTDLLVIDRNAPRFNQGVVAVGSSAALLTGFWPLLALLGTQLAVTVLFGRTYCLPCLAYFRLIQPLVGEGELEDSRAPRFANILGAFFLLGGSALWAAGFVAAGQALGALVAVLATLAVTTGLCVGCEAYRVLARLRGIKGGSVDLVDLEQLGAHGQGEVVVLFTHPLCADCQQVGPRLEQAGNTVVSVDVSRRKDLAKKYGVTVVPLAYLVSADGQVQRRVG
jgi:thiol-disulfide isomerase/thioredoxin